MQKFVVSGVKPGGLAMDSIGNSATPCNKKKLARCQRSYERQKSENKHLHVKPFHSDPTCGHLALAKELSHEYKLKSTHIPQSSVAGKGHDIADHREDLPRAQDDDSGYKSENIHQRLRRQLAIQGSNDPRAANLGKTRGANYVAEQLDPKLDRDTNYASYNQSVNSPRSSTDVSTCSTSNIYSSTVDTVNGTPLDTDMSPLCVGRAHRTELDLVPHQRTAVCNDPQQFVVTAGCRNGGDGVSGGRFDPLFLPSTSTAYMDNVRLVPPRVVSPYVTDLHPYRQFHAQQSHLVPRIHLSPGWSQRFVYQPAPYLHVHVPQNQHQLRHSAITQHYFLRR